MLAFIDIITKNVSGSGDFKILVHLHKKGVHTVEWVLKIYTYPYY